MTLHRRYNDCDWGNYNHKGHTGVPTSLHSHSASGALASHRKAIFAPIAFPWTVMHLLHRCKLLLLMVIVMLVYFIYHFLHTRNGEPCICHPVDSVYDGVSFRESKVLDHQFGDEELLGHKMAILVPLRDRFEELMEFVPCISVFLNEQGKPHHIYVINQVDTLRFNRASLLNVGFLESSLEYDYIAIHDVDLLPLSPSVTYVFPDSGPYHVAAPHLHPRYHYPTFIGGILLLKREHFRKVNGLSNKYWGWGLEDDELYARLKEADLEISRPGPLETGVKNTFKHIHNRKVRRRDMVACYNQQAITRRRDRETGLSTTKYHIHSRRELTIDGVPLTVLNVILECNKTVTPWCDCTENIGNTAKAGQIPAVPGSDVIAPKINRKKHISRDG